MEQERENTLERLEAENNDLRGKIESVKREYEEKRAKMHGMLERMSSAIREYIEFQQSENATKYESMTNEETKHDTEDQEAVSKTEIEVIKIVGNGISVSRKICQENKDLSSPIVFRCLLNLLNKGYLYSINRMKIIDGTYLTLYGLTNKGKEIYKREVGNDPNEPEMEKLETL